jgi:RNA polymerase sigma-70 factor (ECF subfamily)
LPYDYRMALILRELEGYPYEEISIITGWSLATVKSRLDRGRKALRKELQRGRIISERDY